MKCWVNRRCLTGARLCVRNYAHISFFLPLRDVTAESQLFSALPQWLTHRYALHARVCFYCCSCAHHGAGQQAEQGRRSSIEPHDGLYGQHKGKKTPSGFGSESANRGWKKFRIRERTSESSRCTPLLQWTDCTESSPRSLGVTFFPCSLTPLPNIRSHYYTTSSQNLSTMACIKRSSSLARKPTARSGPLS